MLTFLILLTATLYAAIGQGGASGYLALMGLFNIAPQEMKPTALALNIIVTLIATYKFAHAGYFSWKLFLPFAITSIPFAFWGGHLQLDPSLYNLLVGGLLLFASARLFFAARSKRKANTSHPPLWIALLSGAIIGFVSGVTGLGGGIFISPLLLLMGWASTKETAAVAAAFVLLNSAAGLLGAWTSEMTLPPQFIYWGAAVLLGGWLGAEYGSRKLPEGVTCRLLAIILLLGGGKMLLAALG